MPYLKPDFFREASAVIGSPYFYESPPDEEDHDAAMAFLKKRREESDTLRAAFSACEEYKDLRGEAKNIYDRAKTALENYALEDNLRDRLSGPLTFVFSKSVDDARVPELEDQKLMVAAMIQAAENGDHASAAAIGKMRPEDVQEALGYGRVEKRTIKPPPAKK